MARNKGSGWHDESRRHSLARRGIRTASDRTVRIGASGTMKPETRELMESIADFKDGGHYYPPWDVNHPLMRFYRLEMDGSYRGSDYYHRVLDRLRESGGNERKLRSLAIEIFMDSLEDDYEGISRSTIQRTVVKSFSKDELERLNDMLVDRLIVFARDHDIDWAVDRR